MTFEEFQANVQGWSKERGIYEHSTALAQALKAVSEVGELADATIKNDRDALKDAIGDVMVCLVNVAKMTGCDIEVRPLIERDVPENNQVLAALVSYFVADIASDIALDHDVCSIEDGIESLIIYLTCLALDNSLHLLDCCEAAWNEIKDRKGHMVAGGAFVKDE